MATHSGILAWEIPWTEEPCRLQSTGLQRVRQPKRLSTSTSLTPSVLEESKESWALKNDQDVPALHPTTATPREWENTEVGGTEHFGHVLEDCPEGTERWGKKKGSGENLPGRYTLRRSVEHPDGSPDLQRVRVSRWAAFRPPPPLPFCLCLLFGISILSGCLTLLSCISVSLGIGPFSPGSTWQSDLPAFFVVCLPWVPRNNGVLSGSVFPPCLGGSFPSVWSPLGTHCCTDLLFLS